MDKDLKEAKRLFKLHYRKAMRLKEGGAAWNREIALANHYRMLGTMIYHQILANKY